MAKLTQANVTVGTPHYLSPERWKIRKRSRPCRTSTHRGGRLLPCDRTQVFLGKTVMEICMKHVRTAPTRPGAAGGPVSPGLEGLNPALPAKNPATPSRHAVPWRTSSIGWKWPGTGRGRRGAWWAEFKKAPGRGCWEGFDLDRRRERTGRRADAVGRVIPKRALIYPPGMDRDEASTKVFILNRQTPRTPRTQENTKTKERKSTSGVSASLAGSGEG